MNNWIPKNKTIKSIIILTLFNIALYFFSLFVVLVEIKKVENFYSNTESESFKEQKFETIKSIAEANKESIQSLRGFFIQKGDEVRFIEQIEKIAQTSSINFEIISIDVKPNQTDSFKENVNIKMGIDGTWKDIMLFINKLEKMNFGVLIENVNLDVKNPGNWVGFIDFVIFREK